MIAIFIVLMLYVVVISALVIGFNKVPVSKAERKTPKTTFSVIIPFKDEADHLPHLLASISALNYPKELFEVFLINDNSEDASVNLVTDFISTSTLNILLLHSKNESPSPKKEAIQSAINESENEWIVTTDADCTFNSNWLQSFNSFILEKEIEFISAPVTYSIKNSFFEAFQLLDFSSLIGVTIGSFGLKKPLMCNGANLAYKKSLFKDLNGFEGNTNIASGDDVFLLEKAVTHNKNRVAFLKSEDATVYTKPVNTLQQLISQRIRWASKTGQSNSIATKLLGLLVLATNGLFIISILNIFIGLVDYKFSLLYIALKISIDALLIGKTLSFFNQLKFLKHYIFSAFIYPFFSVYIAFLSLFGGYKWKNRRYKR